DDAALGLDVADDAVLQLEAELDAPPDAGLDRFPEYRPDAVAVVRVDLLEGIGIGADLVVLEQAAVRRAVVDAPALGGEESNQIAHFLRDQAKALLALSQPFLRAPVLGDVAEAPYAADRLPLDELRPGVALEDAAVLELDRIEAFLPGMFVEFAHLPAELLGVLELVEHVGERVLVVPRGEHVRRDAPHLCELLVVGRDLAEVVDDQHSVRGRLERRAQQRQGFPVIDLDWPE